ncbi:hypothetical protein ACFL4A_03895 [bacterium]
MYKKMFPNTDRKNTSNDQNFLKSLKSLIELIKPGRRFSVTIRSLKIETEVQKLDTIDLTSDITDTSKLQTYQTILNILKFSQDFTGMDKTSEIQAKENALNAKAGIGDLLIESKLVLLGLSKDSIIRIGEQDKKICDLVKADFDAWFALNSEATLIDKELKILDTIHYYLTNYQDFVTLSQEVTAEGFSKDKKNPVKLYREGKFVDGVISSVSDAIGGENTKEFISANRHACYFIDSRTLSDENRAKYEANGKQTKLMWAVAAGGLSTRSGGIMTAGFKFFGKDMPQQLMDQTFIALKANAALYEDASFTIMTSPSRINAVCASLAAIADTEIDHKQMKKDILTKGFAKVNFNGIEVYVYLQGLQKRIVPKDEDIDAAQNKLLKDKAKDLGEKTDEYKGLKKSKQTKEKAVEIGKKEAAYMEYEKQLGDGVQYLKESKEIKAGEAVKDAAGEYIENPPGHWDVIRHLAISGMLQEAQENKQEFVMCSNMNNPSAKVDPVVAGIFKKIISDARTNNKPKPISMFLLGENRGEKGGLLAKVTYQLDEGTTEERVQLVEGCAATNALNKRITELSEKGELASEYPFFNTATFLLNVEGLINLFNLNNGDTTVKTRTDKVDRVTGTVPVYVGIKEQKIKIKTTDAAGLALEKEVIVPSWQMERICGDITQIAPWAACVIDRDKDFIPTKQPKDVTNKDTMRLLSQNMVPDGNGIMGMCQTIQYESKYFKKWEEDSGLYDAAEDYDKTKKALKGDIAPKLEELTNIFRKYGLLDYFKFKNKHKTKDGFLFEFENGSWFLVRVSGTEAKWRAYTQTDDDEYNLLKHLALIVLGTKKDDAELAQKAKKVLDKKLKKVSVQKHKPIEQHEQLKEKKQSNLLKLKEKYPNVTEYIYAVCKMFGYEHEAVVEFLAANAQANNFEGIVVYRALKSGKKNLLSAVTEAEQNNFIRNIESELRKEMGNKKGKLGVDKCTQLALFLQADFSYANLELYKEFYDHVKNVDADLAKKLEGFYLTCAEKTMSKDIENPDNLGFYLMLSDFVNDAGQVVPDELKQAFEYNGFPLLKKVRGKDGIIRQVLMDHDVYLLKGWENKVTDGQVFVGPYFLEAEDIKSETKIFKVSINEDQKLLILDKVYSRKAFDKYEVKSLGELIELYKGTKDGEIYSAIEKIILNKVKIAGAKKFVDEEKIDWFEIKGVRGSDIVDFDFVLAIVVLRSQGMTDENIVQKIITDTYTPKALGLLKYKLFYDAKAKLVDFEKVYANIDEEKGGESYEKALLLSVSDEYSDVKKYYDEVKNAGDAAKGYKNSAYGAMEAMENEKAASDKDKEAAKKEMRKKLLMLAKEHPESAIFSAVKSKVVNGSIISESAKLSKGYEKHMEPGVIIGKNVTIGKITGTVKKGTYIENVDIANLGDAAEDCEIRNVRQLTNKAFEVKESGDKVEDYELAIRDVKGKYTLGLQAIPFGVQTVKLRVVNGIEISLSYIKNSEEHKLAAGYKLDTNILRSSSKPNAPAKPVSITASGGENTLDALAAMLDLSMGSAFSDLAAKLSTSGKVQAPKSESTIQKLRKILPKNAGNPAVIEMLTEDKSMYGIIKVGDIWYTTKRDVQILEMLEVIYGEAMWDFLKEHEFEEGKVSKELKAGELLISFKDVMKKAHAQALVKKTVKFNEKEFNAMWKKLDGIFTAANGPGVLDIKLFETMLVDMLKGGMDPEKVQRIKEQIIRPFVKEAVLARREIIVNVEGKDLAAELTALGLRGHGGLINCEGVMLTLAGDFNISGNAAENTVFYKLRKINELNAEVNGKAGFVRWAMGKNTLEKVRNNNMSNINSKNVKNDLAEAVKCGRAGAAFASGGNILINAMGKYIMPEHLKLIQAKIGRLVVENVTAKDVEFYLNNMELLPLLIDKPELTQYFTVQGVEKVDGQKLGQLVNSAKAGVLFSDTGILKADDAVELPSWFNQVVIGVQVKLAHIEETKDGTEEIKKEEVAVAVKALQVDFDGEQLKISMALNAKDIQEAKPDFKVKPVLILGDAAHAARVVKVIAGSKQILDSVKQSSGFVSFITNAIIPDIGKKQREAETAAKVIGSMEANDVETEKIMKALVSAA